jgi:ParB/RepB/Spo0J family partition protein
MKSTNAESEKKISPSSSASKKKEELDKMFSSGVSVMESSKYKTSEINTLEIHVYPQIRKTPVSEEYLDELAESIRIAGGLFHPIVVIPEKDKKGYRLVIGENRYKAYVRKLNKLKIPAIIREDISIEQIPFFQFLENDKRDNLTKYDQVLFIAELENSGLSQTQISVNLKKSKSWVNQFSTIHSLSLCPSITIDFINSTPTDVLVEICKYINDPNFPKIISSATSGIAKREFLELSKSGYCESTPSESIASTTTIAENAPTIDSIQAPITTRIKKRKILLKNGVNKNIEINGKKVELSSKVSSALDESDRRMIQGAIDEYYEDIVAKMTNLYNGTGKIRVRFSVE